MKSPEQTGLTSFHKKTEGRGHIVNRRLRLIGPSQCIKHAKLIFPLVPRKETPPSTTYCILHTSISNTYQGGIQILFNHSIFNQKGLVQDSQKLNIDPEGFLK